MLRLAAERDALKVIADQIGAPTGADLLADVTAHAVRRLQAEPELAGTYHCVAGGETTGMTMRTLVIEWARARWPVPSRWRPMPSSPIPTSAYPTPAHTAAEFPPGHQQAADRPSACTCRTGSPAWSAC
jgi:dTDP-4-dehydrorhamnose reductase